jgi:hypothetical protein
MKPRPDPSPRAHALAVLAALGIALWAPQGASAASPRADPAASRGALLYDTHCIGCHTTQAHWRDRRLVTDWSSLREQVRRWQDLQRLGWTEDDITLVARHLNARFYKVREGGERGPSARATDSATSAARRSCSAGGRSCPMPSIS